MISEYENFEVRTSQPIRLPPVTTCAMEGCLNQCEPKSSTCRECRESETRREIRGVDPKPITYETKPYCSKTMKRRTASN